MQYVSKESHGIQSHIMVPCQPIEIYEIASSSQ